eukprot:5701553-Prymnesium_polylepis.1
MARQRDKPDAAVRHGCVRVAAAAAASALSRTPHTAGAQRANGCGAPRHPSLPTRRKPRWRTK